jgi:Tfp pilus assembly protein PilN
MRPVNLIPPEERRGDRAPLRTGNLSYVLLGGLALLLLAVIATALTSKQISDRETEKQGLEQELQQATAEAQSLQAFVDFRTIQETRAATVSSLAQSRFDWERVVRELSLVLPSDVWLTSLTGTVSPEVQLEGGEDVAIRSTVEGPALELVGCAPSEDSVAAFISALEDIDGVTRVGVNSSEQTDASQGSAGGGAGGEGGEDCRVQDFISQFQIVVAFDAVPTPGTASTAPSVPVPAAPSGDGAQLADAQAQQATAKASAAEQTGKADKAVDTLVPGG